MKYYRIATRSDVESIWRWRSTVLVTRWTVFQFLQPYKTLPQDRLKVFTASSREDLDVQLACENQGLGSDSLTVEQFLHPQLSSQQEVTQANLSQHAASDTAAPPASLIGRVLMYVEYAKYVEYAEQEERRREELEVGLGGDHDLPYTFESPSSPQQALAWKRLLARVQDGTQHP